MLLKCIFVPLSHCSNKHYETKELHIPLQHAAADDDADVRRTLVGSIVSTLGLETISEDNIHAHEAKPTSQKLRLVSLHFYHHIHYTLPLCHTFLSLSTLLRPLHSTMATILLLPVTMRCPFRW